MNRRGLLGLLGALMVGMALLAYSLPLAAAEESKDQGGVTASQMVVPPGHWSYQAITYLQSQGVLGAGEVASQGLSRYDFARLAADALAQITQWRRSGRTVPIELESVVERLLIEYSPELSQLARSGQGGAQPMGNVGDLEERVSDLEEQLEELQGETDENSSFLENLMRSGQVHGYVDLEFEDGNDSPSTFDQNHTSLIISASPFERTLFNSEIEFEHGGAEVGVEFMQIDYSLDNRNTLRAGKVILPIGWYNLHHTSPETDFTSVPLLNQRIIPATWAEAGIGITGRFDYQGKASYGLYITQGMNNNISESGLRNARPSSEQDNNNAKAILASLTFHPNDEWFFGGSWYHSVFDGEGNAMDQFAFFVNYDRFPWEFTGEYAFVNLDEAFFVPGSAPPPEEEEASLGLSQEPIPLPTEMWGYYLEGVYRIPTGGDGVFSFAVRWGQVDTSDLSDDDDTDRLTIGVNFRPNPRIIYKLEYQINDSLDPAFDENRLLGSVVLTF